MIDSMFQAGTDAALDDQVRRPAPFKPDQPGASFGQLAAAPFQGVASGSAKTAAFGAEIAGAFGDVAGAGGFNAGGMFSLPTDEERKQQETARRRLLEQGPQYSNPVGDELRQRAKEVMPDPGSTHASAQVVAGLFEFASQAVGYAAGAGPLAAPLLGADVALAEADKLKRQGVDLATRSKAGAVAGITAGASITLPVVGKTVAQTVGLVVAGGPGGFIAQNVAERAILENAGYGSIASQYDPLDPVGLALATIVPAGFGAVAMRGARARAANAPSLKEVVLGIESNGQRYAKDGSVLTSPKGAKGEMQVMDGTNLAPGFGVRPAADNSLAERARVGSDYLDAMLARYGTEDKAMAAYNAGPGALDKALARAAKEGGDYLRFMPEETQAYVAKGMKKLGQERTAAGARAAIERDPEAVAAARVRQTADQLDSYRLTPDGDLAGMTRHQDAMETAHGQLARGEPVSVSDLLALESVRTGRMLDDLISESEGQRAELLGDAGNLADPGRVREIRSELAELQSRRPDDSPEAIKALAKEMQAGEQLSYKRALAAAEKEIGTRLAAHDAQLQRVQGQLDTQARAQQATEQVGALDAKITDLRTQRGTVDAPASSPRLLAVALADVFRPPAPRVRTVLDAPTPRARATGRQMLDAAGESMPRPAPAEQGSPTAAGEAASRGSSLDSQMAEVSSLDPNLMVQLEGMDAPMRASDLLDQVKKEAADDAQEATFVETAVNCLLRSE